MAKIRLLEQHVSELIAAGEVIERPASIVKELLENAVDAAASVIELEIRNGGKTLIRVTDNGSGIEPEDVPKAFLRHATSKIQQQQDLDQIGTLGFRGEALASICAVSRVELLTRVPGMEFGTRYVVEDGQEICLEECGCREGTTLLVEHLFEHVPARLKFLKKDTTEGNLIQATIERIALSHPEISFRMIRNGKRQFRDDDIA